MAFLVFQQQKEIESSEHLHLTNQLYMTQNRYLLPLMNDQTFSFPVTILKDYYSKHKQTFNHSLLMQLHQYLVFYYQKQILSTFPPFQQFIVKNSIIIMYILHILITLNLLCFEILTQSCLNYKGQIVSWWVILKVPPKIGQTGFGYYDSTFTTAQFKYYDLKVDLTVTALTQTLQQINTRNLEHVAWNDEHPDNKTSFTLGHTKGLLAYDPQGTGFFLSHSLPKYPAFVNNKVNLTIASGENYYGQNLLCVSLSIDQLDKLSYNLVIIYPYVYQSFVKPSVKNTYIVELSQSKFPKSSTPFTYYSIQLSDGTKIQSIFKNNLINGSIFQDAMTVRLGSNLTAETWGRPIEKAWCAKGFQVKNVVTVKLAQITWSQQDDHSKWVSAKNHACYGDMNRMSSQWKRGGAFFCIANSLATSTLNSVIASTDHC